MKQICDPVDGYSFGIPTENTKIYSGDTLILYGAPKCFMTWMPVAAISADKWPIKKQWEKRQNINGGKKKRNRSENKSKKKGGTEVLINNAGVIGPARFMADTDQNAW
jgi:hypothetical protein